MSKVTYWKEFTVASLLERKTPPSTGVPAKSLTVFEEQTDELIPLITRGKKNNGIVGFINKMNFATAKNKITYNDQFGLVLYHPYEFTTIKDHMSILESTNPKLKEIMDSSDNVNIYLSKMIQKALSKEIFSFNYSPTDFRFGRELILLPICECSENDSIWKFNDKNFTVDVEKIDFLLNESRKAIRQKTVDAYKKSRDYFEQKEKEYKKQIKNNLNTVWKTYRLDELFSFNSSNQLSANKKNLDISPCFDEYHKIALITQSEKNNGISGYLEETEEVSAKKMINYMTYSMHFGLCFYHDYDFVLMDTHGSVFRLIPLNVDLKNVLEKYKDVNLFISKQITKVCKNGIYNYGWLPNSTRASRELIALPFKEAENDEAIVFESNGIGYTFDVFRMMYLYSIGQKNMFDYRIKNYKSYIGEEC